MANKGVRMFLLSGLGAGYLPGAPGTWGSVAATLLWLAVAWLCGPDWLLLWLITAGGVVAAAGVCVVFAPAAIAATGRDDPQFVTADEFAGQWLALLSVQLLTAPAFALLSLLLFRLFDILKPWPCRWLEGLPRGWGIAADDLMAGLYAGLAVWLCQVVLLLTISGTPY